MTASMHGGIRGPLYGKEDLEDDERLGFSIVTTEFVEEQGVEATLERIRTRIGDKPLYISIDIDVLDPAHAPGTGTPEVAGLSTREMFTLLRLFRGLDIVGADVVEVAPPYDWANLTAMAAAQVVYEFVCLFGMEAARAQRT